VPRISRAFDNAEAVSNNGTTSTPQWVGSETTPAASARNNTSNTCDTSSVIEMQ